MNEFDCNKTPLIIPPLHRFRPYTPAPPEGVYCFTSVRPYTPLHCFTPVRPSVRQRYFSSHFSQQLLLAEI